jgi:hemerythrin HHE cation binding domain-containing protein
MKTKRRARAKKLPGVRQIRRAAGITEPKSAVVLLKADHREVEALFKAYKRSESAAEKQTLAKKICDALKVHTRIEEEIFYPAFLKATGEESIRNEALVEHDGAKKLIAEIEKSALGDRMTDARVTVLSEMIKHHVKEEEGFGGMFSKARRSKMDLMALGALLEARKQELMRDEPAQRNKTPRGTRASFMGAAALARAEGPRPHARRQP